MAHNSHQVVREDVLDMGGGVLTVMYTIIFNLDKERLSQELFTL